MDSAGAAAGWGQVVGGRQHDETGWLAMVTVGPEQQTPSAAPNLTPAALDKPVAHEASARQELPATSLAEPSAPACPQRLGQRFALPTLTDRVGGGGEHFFLHFFLVDPRVLHRENNPNGTQEEGRTWSAAQA